MRSAQAPPCLSRACRAQRWRAALRIGQGWLNACLPAWLATCLPAPTLIVTLHVNAWHNLDRMNERSKERRRQHHAGPLVSAAAAAGCAAAHARRPSSASASSLRSSSNTPLASSTAKALARLRWPITCNGGSGPGGRGVVRRGFRILDASRKSCSLCGLGADPSADLSRAWQTPWRGNVFWQTSGAGTAWGAHAKGGYRCPPCPFAVDSAQTPAAHPSPLPAQSAPGRDILPWRHRRRHQLPYSQHPVLRRRCHQRRSLPPHGLPQWSQCWGPAAPAWPCES